MYRRGATQKERSGAESGPRAELLVFGYACKLFRDDERASEHERGEQLIPWMGDKSLMIDRSVEHT